MNNSILLIISITACLFVTVLTKHLAIRYKYNTAGRLFMTSCTSLGCAVTLLLMSDIKGVSLFSLLLAVVFATVTTAQKYVYLQALETGPLSLTSIITMLSTIIPALSGVVFWGEALSLGKIAGMILILVSMVLSVDSNSPVIIKTKKWYLYCGLSFITTGLVGVLQKVHQKSPYKDELDAFLVVAFFVSTFFALIMMFLTLSRKPKNGEEKPTLKGCELVAVVPIAIMIFSSICTALNNKFNLYLSGVMDSAVFFPIVNGSAIVLNLVSSILLFKEKISKKQWLGIFLGTAAIIILCIA